MIIVQTKYIVLIIIHFRPGWGGCHVVTGGAIKPFYVVGLYAQPLSPKTERV